MICNTITQVSSRLQSAPAGMLYSSLQQAPQAPGHAPASSHPLTCPACAPAAGRVGASELADLFQNLGHPLTYERLVEIMRKYDIDHSGEIEFGEFLRMFQTELLDLQEVLDYILGDAPEQEATSRQAGVSWACPLVQGTIFLGVWGEERPCFCMLTAPVSP